MERDHKNGLRDNESMGWQDSEGTERGFHERDTESKNANSSASEETDTDENRHHQAFGNRKYESHTNHSSADDQPMTNTGPGAMGEGS